MACMEFRFKFSNNKKKNKHQMYIAHCCHHHHDLNGSFSLGNSELFDDDKYIFSKNETVLWNLYLSIKFSQRI
ncbi:hypothetical protein DERP_000019 [Dermatophagoides pteronyssinus]|uniref:Uncharacterized protein n=1 Tax=Dermatophagoides pteronyssinus TaxID=6956 RepID=A0ABQ8IZ28_DERPT|nr:hypothetical protein DERP_000019 [Dermatophagoides pteronyssinus]